MENMHLPTETLNTLKPEIVILEVGANDAAKTIYQEENIVFQVMAQAGDGT